MKAPPCGNPLPQQREEVSEHVRPKPKIKSGTFVRWQYPLRPEMCEVEVPEPELRSLQDCYGEALDLPEEERSALRIFAKACGVCGRRLGPEDRAGLLVSVYPKPETRGLRFFFHPVCSSCADKRGTEEWKELTRRLEEELEARGLIPKPRNKEERRFCKQVLKQLVRTCSPSKPR